MSSSLRPRACDTSSLARYTKAIDEMGKTVNVVPLNCIDALLMQDNFRLLEHPRHHSHRSASDEMDAALVVRDSFLCCMAELLGGICDFVRKSEAKRLKDSLR